MKKIKIILVPLITILVVMMSCQKMSRPPLGDYPKDSNPPGGPLKFYAAFDGTTSDALRNAVDSTRAIDICTCSSIYITGTRSYWRAIRASSPARASTWPRTGARIDICAGWKR